MKEGYRNIGITIRNKEPPKFVIKFKSLSRESLAELIAVIDSLKLRLIEKYNKTCTSLGEIV